jgi:signal transduction histidine kinase
MQALERNSAETLPRLAVAGAVFAALVALAFGWLTQRAVIDARARAATEAGIVAAIEDAQVHLQTAALAVRDGLTTGEGARWAEFDDATARLQMAIEGARAQGRAVEELATPLARSVELWREFRELQRLGRTDDALRRIADQIYVERTAAVREAFARLVAAERNAAGERARALEARSLALLTGAGLAGAAAMAAIGWALVATRRARDALTADRERLRLSLGAMSDGLLYYDAAGRLAMSNPRMAEMFPEIADVFVPGTHFESVLRRAHAAGLLIDPEGIDAHIERRHRERKLPSQRRELALADGRTILIRESTTAEGGRLLVLSDATAEKSADRAKADFVSTVSHELRTPLTSISGALTLVGAGAAGELGPKARQLVEIAGRNAERLARLVDDLLNVQRLEAPIDDIVAVPVPLEPLLERAALEIAPMALKRGVRIARVGAVPADARVSGDEHRLIQVLHNLLSNAVKFSPAGERVDLSARKLGGMWRISVSDRGPGIPAAFRDQVFRRFAQADSGDTRARGGTGLGLSIAKAIVDKLDGRISFETEMGTGTTFTVELAACDGVAEKARA